MTKTISISIPDTLYQKIKDLGISPRKTFPSLIEWYVTNSSCDIARVFMLNQMYDEIKKMEHEIEVLENKKRILAALKQNYNKVKRTKKVESEALTLQELIGYLNKRIIAYHYNYEEVLAKQSDVVQEIKRLDKRFSLKKHIDEVRLLREQVLG